MYKHVYTTLFFLCCIYTSNAQTRDFPEFPTPQQDFYKLLEEKKVMNPKYLDGSVKEVSRTYTQHISPVSDELYTANYYYRLKKDKEITEYTTSDLYDDTTVSYLNSALPAAILNDTIIHEDDFYTYIYTKGKLTYYMAYEIGGGTMDSIVYTYKNDLLKTRTHYQSQGAVEADEEGYIDESVIYFSEFEIYAYGEATYSKTGQIRTLKQYEFTLEGDLIDTYDFTYSYDNKGRFKSLKVISDLIFLTFKQLEKHPKKWDIKDNESEGGMYLETEIHVTYNNKDNILTHSRTDSKKNSEVYTITHGDGLDKTILIARDDYNDHTDTVMHLELIYKFTYDSQNNPIHITSHIMVDDKKILDKTTVLEITYY